MFKLYSPLTLDFDTTASLTVTTARGITAKLERDMRGDWSIDGDATDQRIADLIGECGELEAGLEALSEIDRDEELAVDRVEGGKIRLETSLSGSDTLMVEVLGALYRVNRIEDDDIWAGRYPEALSTLTTDADLAVVLFRLLEHAATEGMGRDADEIDTRAAALVEIRGQVGRWVLYTVHGGWRTQYKGTPVREFTYVGDAVAWRYAMIAGRGAAWS